jgi:hypothetical protein
MQGRVAYEEALFVKRLICEVEGEGGYVITSNGPVKIVGANVPDFCDLSKAE